MVLDHVEVTRNPARRVELPERNVEEVLPPTASHVDAIVRAVGRQHRVPTLGLGATGMRISELMQLTWATSTSARAAGASAARTKTGRARWILSPAALLAAVLERVPREDRDLESRVFAGPTDAQLRVAISRACKATGTLLFSPHDLSTAAQRCGT